MTVATAVVRCLFRRTGAELDRWRDDDSRPLWHAANHPVGSLDAHDVLVPRHVPGQAGALLHPALHASRAIWCSIRLAAAAQALQARVEGRRTISNDLSPLAYVL